MEPLKSLQFLLIRTLPKSSYIIVCTYLLMLINMCIHFELISHFIDAPHLRYPNKTISSIYFYIFTIMLQGCTMLKINLCFPKTSIRFFFSFNHTELCFMLNTLNPRLHKRYVSKVNQCTVFIFILTLLLSMTNMVGIFTEM